MKFEDLKPGTVLSCVWGYSMSIVDFYRVKSTRGKCTVVLERLRNKIVDTHDGWDGHVIPDFEHPLDEMSVRFSPKYGCVKLSNHQFLRIWDGQPKYYNHAD